MTYLGLKIAVRLVPDRAKKTTIRQALAAVVLGTGLGQVITALSAPLVARLYTPVDMGTYTAVNSVAAILGAAAALRWEVTIVLPREEEDAYSLTLLGLISAAVTTTVGLGFLLVFGEWAAHTFGSDELMPWLLFAPVIAGLQGTMLVLNQLAVRRRIYRAVARRPLVRSASVALVQIGAGILSFGSGGLLASVAAGNAAATLSSSQLLGMRSSTARLGYSWRHCKNVLSRYRSYPLTLGPAALINVLGIQLPILMIFALYGSAVAGWLGMTQLVLAIPLALFGRSLGQVYSGELSRMARVSRDRMASAARRAALALTVGAIPLSVGVFFLSPVLFPVVFGDSWASSGVYARALSFKFAAQLVCLPLTQILIICGRQSWQLSWDIARLLATCGSVLIASRAGLGPEDVVWVYSIVGAVTYVVHLLLQKLSIHHPGRTSILNGDN